MSFDIFMQGFANGEAREGGAETARDVLTPFVTETDAEYNFLRIRVGDGDADVYLNDSGLLVNHVSGVGPWELLCDVARATNWVVMPVGCPVCLTSADQQRDLPEGLDEDVRVISSGTDLLDAVSAH